MSDNSKIVWDYLKGQGLSDHGTAGLMGNLYAESGINPKNLQNSYEKRLGYTDAGYTAAVDSGKYTNFVKDGAGYGLAQWTYWSRKQGLLDYAKKKGKSIGDLTTQLEYLMQELTKSYPAVLKTLKSATSVKTASNAVLLQFEKPADQGTAVQAKRAQYGQDFYTKYAKGASSTMSNSSLVDYTLISPNKNSPRNDTIKKITIHHMAGNLTVEQCGAGFAKSSRQASSNYGIGTDGRVGMYVEEKDRSWCSSSPENDHQAITIEVANDGGEPDWHVSDKAYNKLIELCVDICKRNGIEKLNFTGDATGNLTMHKYFTATACPGPYLSSKFPEIAEAVNQRLNPADGWVKTGGKWYYYEKGNPVKSAWRKVKGTGGTFWYYLGADGAMLTGTQKINGKVYHLHEKAACGLPEGALVITNADGEIQF